MTTRKGQSVSLPDNIADDLIGQDLAHDPNAQAIEPANKKKTVKKKRIYQLILSEKMKIQQEDLLDLRINC